MNKIMLTTFIFAFLPISLNGMDRQQSTSIVTALCGFVGEDVLILRKPARNGNGQITGYSVDPSIVRLDNETKRPLIKISENPKKYELWDSKTHGDLFLLNRKFITCDQGRMSILKEADNDYRVWTGTPLIEPRLWSDLLRSVAQPQQSDQTKPIKIVVKSPDTTPLPATTPKQDVAVVPNNSQQKAPDIKVAHKDAQDSQKPSPAPDNTQSLWRKNAPKIGVGIAVVLVSAGVIWYFMPQINEK